MKKMLLPVCCLLLVLSSCTNADPKKMANDLCDCVQTKKKMSSEARKTIVKAAKSDEDFQTAIQTELGKIDDEDKKQTVRDELTSFFELIQSKKVVACAEEIDKKYRVMKTDEKDIQTKMVNAMDDVDGCEAYAAIVKVGLAKKEGKDDTKTEDEEETPKKKKTTEEE